MSGGRCTGHRLRVVEVDRKDPYAECIVCGGFYGYIKDVNSLNLMRDAINKKGYFDPERDFRYFGTANRDGA